MSCPFLYETRVRSCQGASVKKMLAVGQGDQTAERCSNSSHADCPVYRDLAVGEDAGSACPYSHEALVHYCGAAPVMKFIPFSDQAGRCGGSGFRFCELYLQIERAGQRVSAPRSGDITVPADLYYAPNHLWLHVGENGACHIGIDGFFASVLGSIDAVTFVTTSGVERPNALLSVHGIDWPITFRNRVLITGAHLYLRSNPAPLTADPYGSGWLFEGFALPDVQIQQGLMSGAQALAWMEQERSRLDEMIHQFAGSQWDGESAVLNDGGCAVRDVLRQLGREETVRMLHAFFAQDRNFAEEVRR